MDVSRKNIRKVLAVFFIAMANIAILAHIIIPHHHHATGVSFCLASNNSSCDDNSSCSHNHENNDKEAICSIQNIVIGNHNEDADILVFSDSCLPCDCISCFLSESHSFNFSQYSLSKTQQTAPTYLERQYLMFATKCLGLRAPPIVS